MSEPSVHGLSRGLPARLASARAGPSPIPADRAGIRLAARALRTGQLVVFPTETVYGVGANALDEVAVQRIFRAKGRPIDNPVIVHAADAAAARGLTQAWPEAAELLARAFWPGPLTLVLPKSPCVPSAVAAGLDSVAVRVPAHPVVLALLAEAEIPIAAPSANRFGGPSPTRVEDAMADLGDAVSVYLDGGRTQIGIESTVVNLLVDPPEILRPGGVPMEALEQVLGPVRRASYRAEDGPPRSPGMKYRHYAPRASVHLVRPEEIRGRVATLREGGRRVAIIASEENAPLDPDVRVPGSRNAPEAWARSLFVLFRDLDREGYDVIVVEAIPEVGLGAAVVDRVRKAAAARS